MGEELQRLRRKKRLEEEGLPLEFKEEVPDVDEMWVCPFERTIWCVSAEEKTFFMLKMKEKGRN